MNWYDFLKKEEIISLSDNTFNAIALPSIQQAKYIINLNNKRVFFAGLNLLSTRSVKASIAKKIYSCLYHLGIIKKIFKSQLITLNADSELFKTIGQQFQYINGINIYIGYAKNENLSLTFQIVEADKEYYLRYPVSDTAKILHTKEYANINYLSQIYPLPIQKLYKTISNCSSRHPEWNEGFSELKHNAPFGDLSSQATQDNVQAVTTIDSKNNFLFVYEGIVSKITRTKLCSNKMNILRELSYSSYELTKNNLAFQKLCTLIELTLNETENEEVKKLIVPYQYIIQHLSELSIKKAFFHGDFSPDNILIANKQYYLIDFEYSETEFFVCFDLFHYFYKANKLHLKVINNKEVLKIRDLIKRTYKGYPFSGVEELDNVTLVRYLFTFYLFFLLKRYLMDEKMNSYNGIVTRLAHSILTLSEQSICY